jgi:hypothetical protein
MKRVLFSLLLALGCSGTTALNGNGGEKTGSAPTVPAASPTGGAGATTAATGGANAPGTINPGGTHNDPSASGGATTATTTGGAGGAASPPGAPPPGCHGDGDCRLFDDYCTGCDCRALLTTEADPRCTGPGVRCLRQPCGMARAVCEVGVCKVVRM